MAMPAAIRSSGADTAAAAVSVRCADVPARPSQLSSAEPPSDTPHRVHRRAGVTRARTAASIPPISSWSPEW